MTHNNWATEASEITPSHRRFSSVRELLGGWGKAVLYLVTEMYLPLHSRLVLFPNSSDVIGTSEMYFHGCKFASLIPEVKDIAPLLCIPELPKWCHCYWRVGHFLSAPQGCWSEWMSSLTQITSVGCLLLASVLFQATPSLFCSRSSMANPFIQDPSPSPSKAYRNWSMPSPPYLFDYLLLLHI